MVAASLLACSVGSVQTVASEGRNIRTAIYKAPVEGQVRVFPGGLEGDQQADPRYHGGLLKAVYAYPHEHYPYWESLYPNLRFAYGMFGENLTTAGLLEQDLRIGDVLRIGTAVFAITQPRTPCSKLAMKFGDKNLIKRFQQSGRSGFYLAVREEGVVKAGDPIEVEPNATGQPLHLSRK